jgi:hypothetical protein
MMLKESQGTMSAFCKQIMEFFNVKAGGRSIYSNHKINMYMCEDDGWQGIMNKLCSSICKKLDYNRIKRLKY